MNITTELENIITSAMILADTCRNKLVTPEHLLLSALGEQVVCDVLESTVLDLPIDEVKEKLREYIDRQEHFIEEEEPHRQLYASHQYGELMQLMEHDSELTKDDVVDVPHFFLAMIMKLQILTWRFIHMFMHKILLMNMKVSSIMIKKVPLMQHYVI